MVKITYNSTLAQKEPNKPHTDDALIPEEKDVETGRQQALQGQSRVPCGCVCLGLSTLILLITAGLGGAYIYNHSTLPMRNDVVGDEIQWRMQSAVLSPVTVAPSQDPGRMLMWDCIITFDDLLEETEDYVYYDYLQAGGAGIRLGHILESVQVLEEEEVELINVSELSDSDPAHIVHDFSRSLTAYLDLSLDTCYITPLNTSIVMPPTELQELLMNIKASTYLAQVHEQMLVGERVDDVEQLGNFIDSLCRGRDAYMLDRRAHDFGIQKREALNCRKIRHFENKFVVETQICEP